MASVLRTSLPSGEERAAAGRALRQKVKRGALGRWRPATQMLAASRRRSHSQPPGCASSKSLRSITRSRSGEA